MSVKRGFPAAPLLVALSLETGEGAGSLYLPLWAPCR